MTAGVRNNPAGRHWYRIFGLLIRSEFELPEASAPLDDVSESDVSNFVEIKRGSVPTALAHATKLATWIEVGQSECLYNIEGICRILVTNGRSITVDVEPGIAESDVRAFLFGSALGTVVHQRKLVPLHISAVRSPIGVVAFTGPSGAGKSTLAAALLKYNGWPIICDDMAVVDPSDNQLVLHSGIRRNKLWSDAIRDLGLGDRPMLRDFSRYEKFHLEIDGGAGESAPSLKHLFELAWSDALSIRELSASNRFVLTMNSVYRPYLATTFGNLSAVQAVAIELSRRVRSFVLARPKDLHSLRHVASALSRHCESAN